MKRGRPKGRSRDNRSFGPLGDLIRSHRLARRLGLLDVAKACQCSVQFISNIEHGRAPLPWDKVGQLATFLKIPLEDLQAANLSIRSDFKSFVKTTKSRKVRTPASLLHGMSGIASAVTSGNKDNQLSDVIKRYNTASVASKKKFYKAAMRLLAS